MSLYDGLNLRYPIDAIKWARGYCFIVSYLEDLGVKSASTNACPEPMSEYEMLMRFKDAHEKQVHADAKDYIETEIKAGYQIDDLLVKKYLQ